MPKISVIMAIHNGLPYLMQAVESILHQTFTDFEFLIIDDESTDGSWEQLDTNKDPRIQVIRNQKQLGLSASLNLGLDVAKGEYVARMDHDDISLPTRLEEQSAYLDAHSDVDLVGTWAKTLGLPREQTWRYPSHDEDIRSEFIFGSTLVHSSVMLRKTTFERHQLRYDPKIERAQDYEFWTRAAPNVRFANLSNVLLHYRVHPHQVGQIHGSEQKAVADEVRARELSRLGLKPTAEQEKIHNEAGRWAFSASRAGLDELEDWFLTLRSANQRVKYYPLAAFDRVLERRWWVACRVNVALGLIAWKSYTGSPLSGTLGRGLLEKAQFWAKCLLRELGWRRP